MNRVLVTSRAVGSTAALGPRALRQLCDVGQVTFAACLSPLVSQGWVAAASACQAGRTDESTVPEAPGTVPGV